MCEMLLSGLARTDWRDLRTADVDTLPIASRKYRCLAVTGASAGSSCTSWTQAHQAFWTQCGGASADGLQAAQRSALRTRNADWANLPGSTD